MSVASNRKYWKKKNEIDQTGTALNAGQNFFVAPEAVHTISCFAAEHLTRYAYKCLTRRNDENLAFLVFSHLQTAEHTNSNVDIELTISDLRTEWRQQIIRLDVHSVCKSMPNLVTSNFSQSNVQENITNNRKN